MGFDGNYLEAIDEINHAIKLNPQFINGPYLNMRGQIEMLAGDYENGIETFVENTGRGGPAGPPALCWGAACYAGANRKSEAEELVGRLLAMMPSFSLKNWNYLDLIGDAGVREKVIGLMREAGVPDG